MGLRFKTIVTLCQAVEGPSAPATAPDLPEAGFVQSDESDQSQSVSFLDFFRITS